MPYTSKQVANDYMYGLLRGLFWKYFADFPHWTQLWVGAQVKGASLVVKGVTIAVRDRYFPETKEPWKPIRTVLFRNKFSEHTDCLCSIDRY